MALIALEEKGDQEAGCNCSENMGQQEKPFQLRKQVWPLLKVRSGP